MATPLFRCLADFDVSADPISQITPRDQEKKWVLRRLSHIFFEKPRPSSSVEGGVRVISGKICAKKKHAPPNFTPQTLRKETQCRGPGIIGWVIMGPTQGGICVVSAQTVRPTSVGCASVAPRWGEIR